MQGIIVITYIRKVVNWFLDQNRVKPKNRPKNGSSHVLNLWETVTYIIDMSTDHDMSIKGVDLDEERQLSFFELF